MHMDSSSALINLIHVLQMLETVDTATRNLSAKSFSNSPSLSLMDTNVNSSHNVSFFFVPGLRLFGSKFGAPRARSSATNSSRKKGLLLHCAGIEVQKLFKTLQDPGAAEGESHHADEYQIALRTLDNHFSRQLKEPYEGHVFRSLKKEEGETVDQFITLLHEILVTR